MLSSEDRPVRPPLKPAPQASRFVSPKRPATPPAAPGIADGRDRAIFDRIEAEIADEARQEHESRSARRKRTPRAPAHSGYRDSGSRKNRPARARKRPRPESEAFTVAKEIALETAQRIRAEFGDLSRSDAERLVSVFRSNVVPKRKPGPRPKARITAAYEDWKAGVRGVELFQKHIPGWDKHGEWRRKAEGRALTDAIRSRSRRARLTGPSTRPAPGDIITTVLCAGGE